VLVRHRPYASFERCTSARVVIEKAALSAWQDVFPVLGSDGKVVGMVPSDVLRAMAANPDLGGLAIVHDLMVPPVTVRDTDDLRQALQAILEHGVREVMVLADDGRIAGFLDEAEINRVYHDATASHTEGAPD